MRSLRPLASLLLAMLAGTVVFAVCYGTASRARMALSLRQTNELAWLGREFRLTDAELARVRTLHDGYMPGCREMCAQIAAKNVELLHVLEGATNVGPEVDQKLAEVAGLRARCQARMLRHFQEVARTMPKEEGARYLAEMQRLTLGLHDDVEQVMAHPTHEHP